MDIEIGCREKRHLIYDNTFRVVLLVGLEHYCTYISICKSMIIGKLKVFLVTKVNLNYTKAFVTPFLYVVEC